MKRKLRWVVVAAIVLALIVGLRATLFRTRPIEVEVAQIQRGMVEDAVTNSQAGTVRSRQRARLGVERGGRVARIPHREGSAVKHGEVLLELDATSASVQLELTMRDRDALKAALESERAAATLAHQDYDRTRQLRSQNLVSEEQMDQVKSRLDAASAGLDAAHARLARAESAV